MIETHFLQLLYHIFIRNHNNINTFRILQGRLNTLAMVAILFLSMIGIRSTCPTEGEKQGQSNTLKRKKGPSVPNTKQARKKTKLGHLSSEQLLYPAQPTS